MNDKLRRGCWFFLAASEEQAAAFMERDVLPSTKTMVEAIESKEPFNQFPIFSRQFQVGIDHLHSFTHGGNQIVVPYLTTNEVGASYRDDDIFHALESIEAIGLTAVLITILVAGDSNPQGAQTVLNAFGVEFPFGGQ
ncbi:hypothetical protein EYC55_05145 [Xanthomonas oryzae]|uniref:DUF6988 family protein n=1 Tax=Xanthomonas oryzae TaxID=347 RepID=UPI0010340338|nr:hypothetical protein [Xanthomonas oryzae]QBG94997.1 hypothetical protein EYC55_05145 [Xanthomonas oryzae]